MSVNGLEIKVKRIFRFESGQFLKAFVDIAINDAIIIKGIKIVERKNVLFVSMPQEQAKDKKWYDTVQCMNSDVKELISQEVLAAYHAEEGAFVSK